jgi:2-polyprenyl-3-methyl-5-hydroxy-6-metoxy-1,4-benzoquinol methylase
MRIWRLFREAQTEEAPMTTTTDTETPAVDEERIGAFIGRLLESCVATGELVTVDLGRRLGLYAALTAGRQTAPELAAATGIHPRYAREWLEQQAVAGILEVTKDGVADTRRFSLPIEHAVPLLEEESLAYIGAISGIPESISKTVGALRDAFRTGGGVPYAAYEIHDLQAAFNRPAFANQLSSEWLPTIPGLVERLQADGAEAVEVGCGEGWAAIALATAFPKLHVLALDNDEASIVAARRNAGAAGVQDRVRFEVCDVSEQLDPAHVGRYDLACAFEMLHDVADPVGVLRNARASIKPGGTVLIMDERTQEEFTAPGELFERFFYMASVLHCLPVGMASQPSAGTGTVMRPDTVRKYASDAGFNDVTVLPIEHEMFRFYQLS